MPDALPHRIPGQTLQLRGEIYPSDGGWFGHDTPAQPSLPMDGAYAEPDQALLQRVLTGLHNATTADSADIRSDQETS